MSVCVVSDLHHTLHRMRLAIGGALLALCSTGGVAHADVFVPADPPPAERLCSEAAGDVLVSVGAASRERWFATVSEAGGPWQRVTRRFPPRDVNTCAQVAAAADGTAALSGWLSALT